MIGEFASIDRLLGRLGAPGALAGVALGAGDDCAVLARAEWPVVCLDTLVEGVHWTPKLSAIDDVGYKLLACNLSDVAAMAAVPGPFLLALALPSPFDERFLDALSAGLVAARRDHGLDPEVVTAIGGDTTRANGAAVLSLVLFGRPLRSDRLLRRSGAIPGDGLWVSGPLGESAAALHLGQAGGAEEWAEPLLERHRRPRARLDLVPLLAATEGVHAAIDLSDGLAGDLAHLAQASGVSAELEAAALPMSPACRRAAALLGADPLSLALGGGEDFELLVAADQSAEADLAAAGFSRVGTLGSGPPGSLALCDASGRRGPLTVRGYEHG
jgi:thiamine-monophosphate kinase